MKSVTTSIRLDTSLAARLEQAASRLSRGKNWIVTSALQAYLEKLDRGDLAAEARRQSALVSRCRRRKEDTAWADTADTAGWK